MDNPGQDSSVRDDIPGGTNQQPIPLEVANENEVAIPSGTNNGNQDASNNDAHHDSANSGVNIAGENHDADEPLPAYLFDFAGRNGAMYDDSSDSLSVESESDEEMDLSFPVVLNNGTFSPTMVDVEVDSDSDQDYVSSPPDPNFQDNLIATGPLTNSGLAGSTVNDIKDQVSSMTLNKASDNNGGSTTIATTTTVAHARPAYLENCQICKKSADFVCKGCYRSAYCSEEHQKEDWEKHRVDCVHFELARYPSLLYRGPFRIDRNDCDGKQSTYRLTSMTTIAATKKEKILEEKPFLICPWPRLKIRMSECHYSPGLLVRNLSCFGCGKMLGFSWFRCQNCNLFLCSDNCLYISQHQEQECKIIQQLTSSKQLDARLDLKKLHDNDSFREYLYTDIMIIRLLLKFSKMSEEMTPEQYADEWSKLDFVWKSSTISFAKQNSERLKKIGGNLKVFLGFSYNLVRGNETLLWKMFSILDMNAFPFELPFRRFRALCLVLSLADHSCVPNCHAYLSEPGVDQMDINQIEPDPNELTVVLKCGRDLLRGSVITFSYVPLTCGSAERRTMLLNSHFLWCMCPRCVDPTEFGTFSTNVKCHTCKSAMLVPESAILTQSDADGNPTPKPEWQCRGNIITSRSSAFRRSCRPCPPLKYEIAMCKFRGVEAGIAKSTGDNLSGIADLLASVKSENGIYYNASILKLVEDIIRGTFFPLPDVEADDLKEFSDKALSGIVMSKWLYRDFMRKVNPGFDFEGFPVANLELAENELLGRETGRAVLMNATASITPSSGQGSRLRYIDAVNLLPIYI